MKLHQYEVAIGHSCHSELRCLVAQEVQKRFPDGIPLLDPVDDMGIKDPALKKVIQKVEAFEHRMYTHPLHSDPNLESVYSLCERKALVSFAAGYLRSQSLTFYCLIFPPSPTRQVGFSHVHSRRQIREAVALNLSSTFFTCMWLQYGIV